MYLMLNRLKNINYLFFFFVQQNNVPIYFCLSPLVLISRAIVWRHYYMRCTYLRNTIWNSLYEKISIKIKFPLPFLYSVYL